MAALAKTLVGVQISQNEATMHDGGFSHDELTVGEVADKRMAILAVCKCGHCKELDPRKVCIRPTTPITDVGAVLVCRRCGRRGLSTRVALPGSEYRPA